MRRPIDPLRWSLGDLTGGGAFCSTPSGDIYVVTPAREDGSVGIMLSKDKGDTWEQVWTYSMYPAGTTVGVPCEPQVDYDPEGAVLHFAYHRDTPEGVDLVVFTYHIPTKLVMGPSVVLKAQRFKPSYSVTWDPLEKRIVISAVAICPQNIPAMAGKWGIVESVLDITHAVVRSTPLMVFEMTHRTSYGALQGVAHAGKYELYYNERPRVYQFKAADCHLYRLVRNSGSTVWESPEKIHTFQAEFNDDRLVVKAHDTFRYLTYVYYAKTLSLGQTNLEASLHYRMLLGYYSPDLGWDILDTPVREEACDPSLSMVAQDGADPYAYVAYLSKKAQQGGDGSLFISTWYPKTRNLSYPPLIPRVDAAYLRSPLGISGASGWAFIAVSPTKKTSWYVSDLNLPPTPVLEAPGGLDIKRNVHYTLDASKTTDPDFDPLYFTWEVTHATHPTHVVLTPRGSQADLFVKNSWGQDNGEITVKVSASDEITRPAPLPSASLTLTIPFDAPPSINWVDNPVYVRRGEGVTLAPILSDDSPDLVVSWEQIAGPPVSTSSKVGKTLTLDLSQASVLGESYKFRVSLEDYVNTPVESVIQILVPPIKLAPSLLDGNLLSRSLWLSEENS